MATYALRLKAGAVLIDLPRFLWTMRPWFRGAWVFMRNRDETLIRAGHGRGAQCDWQWTSDLHIAKVFPSLGRTLMNRALRDWPIGFCTEPLRRDENIQVSFVIGHRGMDRLPHLLLTLQSIAAQRDVSIECIVVEQSSTQEVKEHLPGWVRYAHTRTPYADMPYCRAWAFNVGARMARGNVLLLHDNDMLVPQEYAAQLLARTEDRYEVINLKRFIFFLSEDHSKRLLRSEMPLLQEAPETIMQNAEGGGSIAIARDAYFAIGGFDESFIGWGGEDIEFWERAQTLRVWPYGYLPLVHLWHEPQPGKRAVNGNGLYTAELTDKLSAIPPDVRIEALRGRRFGAGHNPEFDCSAFKR